MYELIAKNITSRFMRNGIINDEKKDVYAYGFELLIGYFVYFVIFTFISALTRTIVESYCFFVGFMLVRKYAGGIHAKTYIRCHVLFELNHLLFIGAYYFLSEPYLWILLLAVVFSIITIFAFAPVDNNKRLTENEKKYFKKRSRVYVFIIVIMTVVAVIVPDIQKYAVAYLIGTCSASLSLLLAHFREKLSNVK